MHIPCNKWDFQVWNVYMFSVCLSVHREGGGGRWRPQIRKRVPLPTPPSLPARTRTSLPPIFSPSGQDRVHPLLPTPFSQQPTCHILFWRNQGINEYSKINTDKVDKKNTNTDGSGVNEDQPSTRELLHDFCESTTAHGWAHVVRGRSGFYNRLWLLVTVCAISGAAVHLYHLTTSYLEWVVLYKSILRQPVGRTTKIRDRCSTVRRQWGSMGAPIFGQKFFIFKPLSGQNG